MLKKVKKELNKRCILEPIKWLGSQGFRLLAIYLRKEKTAYINLKDSLMKRITKHIIESNEDYDRQAEELTEMTRAFVK